MPRPKGFEPYTRVWRVDAYGNVLLFKGTNQEGSYLIEQHRYYGTEAGANGFAAQANAYIWTNKVQRVIPLIWYNRKTYFCPAVNVFAGRPFINGISVPT